MTTIGEAPVPFRDMVRVWWRIGWASFGGPAAQIATMHRVIVDERKWVDEPRFLHALNFCMLLPGPEAQQLATYLGWLMHGVRGGLAAGLLFILPGALIMLALSALYAAHADVSFVAAALFGIQCAVLAIVVEAMIRIGRRSLKTRLHRILAVAAFVALYGFAVPFPLCVLGAGVVGLVLPGASPPQDPQLASPRVAWTRTASTLALGVALWGSPIVPLVLWLGSDHVLVGLATFFAKLAVVTFGGAYAVLSYVAQAAVERFQWVSPSEMVDGLGLAETTPGPLILVLQFVGFLAAFRHGAPLEPWTAGVLGAVVTLWVTFVPCFVWIFAGAPYVERLRTQPRLANALACITAAVTGVFLNLAVWFAMNVLFSDVHRVDVGWCSLLVPALGSIRVAAVGIAVVCGWRLLVRKRGILEVLALAVVLGVVAFYAGAWTVE